MEYANVLSEVKKLRYTIPENIREYANVLSEAENTDTQPLKVGY